MFLFFGFALFVLVVCAGRLFFVFVAWMLICLLFVSASFVVWFVVNCVCLFRLLVLC